MRKRDGNVTQRIDQCVGPCHPSAGWATCWGVDASVAAGLDDVVLVHVDFDAFYRSSYAAVVRMCRALCDSDEMAADAVQEAFITARAKWDTVSQYEHPALWVRRVAINRAISWHRRAAAEARALARLPLPPVATTNDDPHEVWALVRKLPRRQAQVIALVYVDDLTVEQAAEVMEVSVPTAKTHLQRARRALAAALDEEMD
jgi:RNA polymerase sigma-70 factor, ECF subfamily